MASSYDLVVLGGGAAGFSAATVAAENGFKVAIVSKGPLGGTCVNYGCVPTKRMLKLLAKARLKGEEPRLPEVLRDAVRVSGEVRKEKYEELAESLGIDVYRGVARVRGKGEVEVEGSGVVRYRRALIIALGASTVVPSVKGIDEALEKGLVYTNETILDLEFHPDSAVIVGGGPQGVEFSQIMARAGVSVTLVNRRRRLLPREEPEAGLFAEEVLREDGVEVLHRASLEEVKVEGDMVKAKIATPDGGKTVEASMIFLATGRRPRLEGLGLEKLGVKIDEKGFVKVDSNLKAAEGVYAAGDIIGEPMLEPVAAREGYVAAVNALGLGRIEMDYEHIPKAVFIEPEIARAGLTERELAERIKMCACRTVPLSLVPRALIEGETRGFAKLVIDPRDKRIVGATIAGPRAAEAIQEVSVMIRAGWTLDDLIDTVHIFPTINEALKYAALAFYRDVSKMPCCLL